MIISKLKTHFFKQISEEYSDSETEFLWQIFVEKIFGLNKIELRNSGEYTPDISRQSEFHNKVLELQQGKPYQQIFSEAEFFGLKFFVNENVLIPRPETEELLELAIQKIKKQRTKNKDIEVCSKNFFRRASFHNEKPITDNQQPTTTILDIGTGSGIIPIVLKKHFPNAEISAMDISEKALEIARKNATWHQTEIRFIQTDYLQTALTGTYDIIISNPPYIGQNEAPEIADSVKEYEPKMALFSPTSDPLIFYKKIAIDAQHHLNENGMVFLEINQKLGKETLELFSNFDEIELIKDMSGNDRFVVGRK